MNALVFASDHWRDHDGSWFPLLFIGLWAFVIVTATRRWRRPAGHAGESALADRFARGEIDETEYRARRDVLRSKN